MSAEKGKGKGKDVGTKKGRQPPTTAKPAMKQKTLFDSFMTRTSSKSSVPTDDQSSEVGVVQSSTDATKPPTASQSNVASVSTPPSISAKDAKPLAVSTAPIEIMDDSESPIAQSAGSSLVEIPAPVVPVDASSEEPEVVPAVQTERERSPSVLLVDDSPPPASTAPTSTVSAHTTSQKPPAAGTSSQNVEVTRDRSPSVVIVEEAPPVASTITRSSSRLKAKGEGKTPDQPILIESSPVKVTIAATRPSKPIHPFFAPKARVLPKPTTTSGPFRRAVSATPDAHGAPFPDRHSQHVRSTQTQNTSSVPWPKRTSHSIPAMDVIPDYQFLKAPTHPLDESIHNEIRPISALEAHHDATLDIPREHQADHPVIDRLLNDHSRGSIVSRRPWTDKWRPSCASEVLGNEASAIYLRNWLRALELQLDEPPTAPANGSKPGPSRTSGGGKVPQRGTKRIRVVRAVEKKRKKSRLDSDEEDDWIVRTDDETDEEVPYEELDEFGEPLPEPPASSPASSLRNDLPDTASPRLAPQKEKEPDLGQLHNTILLVGPHGVGKTAAVYACAEELGWEVFEVYPGIGRRNGANVDNLVGEVGKNHLVLQNRQSEDIMKSFVQSKNKLDPLEPLTVSDYSPRKKSTVRAVSELGDLGLVEMKPIRQSLILLEEVDILYKEDVNFWSTVTRIIGECKRPVVCTCNDVSLIPINDLPLQTILNFSPCAAPIAVSYLKTLCRIEGYDAGPDLLEMLYRPATLRTNILSNTSTDKSQTPDLRQTINALQILCGTSDRSESPGVTDHTLTVSGNINGAIASGVRTSSSGQCAQERSQPRISVPGSEALSYLDCAVEWQALHNFAVAEFADYLPSEDDEIGHPILHDQYAQDATHYGLNDRLAEVLTYTAALSRKAFSVDTLGDSATAEYLLDRASTLEDGRRTIIQEFCPIGRWNRRDTSIALEYVPYIRQIVEAEDLEEARELEKRPKGGRSTRNSARSGFTRSLEVSGDSRGALTTLGLV